MIVCGYLEANDTSILLGGAHITRPSRSARQTESANEILTAEA